MPLSTLRVHITWFVQVSDPYGHWPIILVSVLHLADGKEEAEKKEEEVEEKEEHEEEEKENEEKEEKIMKTTKKKKKQKKCCVCLRPQGRSENFYGDRNRFKVISYIILI